LTAAELANEATRRRHQPEIEQSPKNAPETERRQPVELIQVANEAGLPGGKR
jgi:hypothetical protein